MVVDRASQTWRHHTFAELPEILGHRDFLVLNDTRVFPARLQGRKASGGRVELLLHHLPEPVNQGAIDKARARASYRGRLKVGQVLYLGPDLEGEIIASLGSGTAEVQFRTTEGNVLQTILAKGEVPLPPYIRRAPGAQDQERYQTVYADKPGAIAAPTAGLHFTPEVMASLKNRGIETATLTLHVGPGTFLPVRTPDYTRHQMHPEYFIMPATTAARLNQARTSGKHLVAVGTTSVRVLEHCAGPQGFTPQEGWCNLYIHPGFQFQAVDHLLTNFHLPRSTLLLLVAAFAGRDFILAAYEDAIQHHYRFYSYGDCMLIV
jgi:S-adenosylmethionine:tRNA ribosyltransferase-isomerase